MVGSSLLPRVWALGGVAWRLDASRLPSPAGWGARPGCSQDPPSAEVCQGRELINHDESGEREPVRCPPAAPAPAGPSPGARHTRGPPVPACAAAASWSVRAPLGAGDAWDSGSAVQVTYLLTLACGWHEAGDLLCGHVPSHSPRPELRASHCPAGHSGRTLVTNSAIPPVKGFKQHGAQGRLAASSHLRPAGGAGPASRAPWVPSRCRPAGFPG